MAENNIELVKQAINSVVGGSRANTISAHDNLFEVGILDSLSMVQLIIALENKFSIHFDYKDLQMDHFKSVMNICSMLEGKYKRPVA